MFPAMCTVRSASTTKCILIARLQAQKIPANSSSFRNVNSRRASAHCFEFGALSKAIYYNRELGDERDIALCKIVRINIEMTEDTAYNSIVERRLRILCLSKHHECSFCSTESK